MEHRDLMAAAQIDGCLLDDNQAITLISFARMIESANEQFNLTGHATLREIIEDLIIKSIRPFADFSVPRGTVFIDIGTGAGIPGIPLCIYRQTWRGVLIDSNRKKTIFIEKVLQDCHIENCIVVHGRAEEYARGKERETFGMGVSRAAGNPLVVMEIGAPLIKTGGFLYIFSHAVPDSIRGRIEKHGEALGLSCIPQNRNGEYGIKEEGLLFLKKAATPSTFPRRMAVIKRMARCHGDPDHGI